MLLSMARRLTSVSVVQKARRFRSNATPDFIWEANVATQMMHTRMVRNGSR
jgi:hypothetical protein